MELCGTSLQQCCPLVAAFAGWAGRLKSNAKKDKAMEQGLKMLLRAKVIDLVCTTSRRAKFPPGWKH